MKTVCKELLHPPPTVKNAVQKLPGRSLLRICRRTVEEKNMRNYYRKTTKIMRTMITMILNRLFGSEMSVQRANENDLKLAGEVDECVEKQPEKKLYDDPDLQALYDRYG